jgi:hypothetical protein
MLFELRLLTEKKIVEKISRTLLKSLIKMNAMTTKRFRIEKMFAKEALPKTMDSLYHLCLDPPVLVVQKAPDLFIVDIQVSNGKMCSRVLS